MSSRVKPEPYAASFWADLTDTPAALEQSRIAAGAPWTITEVAGLQYYQWRQDDDMDGRHEPCRGDRLNLVREPENLYDPHAVQVEWRNGVMLGHLPRCMARDVAPALDTGTPLRAYVLDMGDYDGARAWNMRALLIGQPVAAWHGDWIDAAAARLERELHGEQLVEMRDGLPRYFNERRPPNERQQRAAEAWNHRHLDARIHRKAAVAAAFAASPQLADAAASRVLEQIDDPFCTGVL